MINIGFITIQMEDCSACQLISENIRRYTIQTIVDYKRIDFNQFYNQNLKSIQNMYNSASQSDNKQKKILISGANKKIIDSVIKQKISSQMIVIKDNFQNLLKNNDPFKQKKNQKQASFKKRKISINSIEKEKLKRSQSFSPFQSQQNTYEKDFILKRKLFQSPLINLQQGLQLNKARISHDNLYVKMGQLSKPKYQQNLENINSKIFHTLQPKYNLISKHPIIALLEEEKIGKLHISSKPSFQNIFISNNLNEPQNNKKQFTQNIDAYDFKRFAKMDYQILEKWFQDHITNLNKKSAELGQKGFIQRIYSTYIASFQQFIRLTYIENIQKGALFEKLFWSFVLVFDRLLELQHRMNFKSFQQQKSEHDQIIHLYDLQIKDLNLRISRLQKQKKQIELKYNKLGIIYLSYKQVNKECVFQLQQYTKVTNRLIEAYQNLKFEHFKILSKYQETNQIEQINKKYYIINDLNQPEIITHFIGGNQEYEKFTVQLNARKEYQSQLAKYWTKIQDTIYVNNMIDKNQIFPTKKQNYAQTQYLHQYFFDQGIQNYDLKSHVSDITLDQNNQGFEGYLQKQIAADKNLQQNPDRAMIVSLRQLYEDVYKENLNLKTLNQRFISELKREMDIKQQLRRDIQQLHLQNARLQNIIADHKQRIERLHKQLSDRYLLMDTQKNQIIAYETDLKNQRFNNQVLIKNQLELRKKLQKLQKQSSTKIRELEIELKKQKGKILRAVKYFNQYLDLVQDAFDPRYIQIGKQIEQIFEEDLNRDTNTFITK